MKRGGVPELLIVYIYVEVQIGVSSIILHAEPKLPFAYVLQPPLTHPYTSSDPCVLWS